MRSLRLLTIALMISGNFEIFPCLENVERLKEEVLDFAEYLKHKQEKHPAPESSFDPIVSVKHRRSKDNADDSYHIRDHGKKHGDPDAESLLEDLISNNPKSDEHLQESGNKFSSRKTLHSNKKTPKSDASTKPHHALEIVYIRESDSDSNDPIPEMIEKIVHDQPVRRSTREVRDQSPDADPTEEQDAESSMQGDDVNAIHQSDDVCPVRNIASHTGQTCPDGPEYEMKFHPAFSKTLKSEMLEMVPEPGEDMCNYLKPLGPETGVEDRALCPFKRNITNRNPLRMPEYLYEAKCLCQVPNLAHPGRLKCVPVKRSVPVQWLISCEDGKKRYKQGWEEIAVACAPIEVRAGDPGDSPSTN